MDQSLGQAFPALVEEIVLEKTVTSAIEGQVRSFDFFAPIPESKRAEAQNEDGSAVSSPTREPALASSNEVAAEEDEIETDQPNGEAGEVGSVVRPGCEPTDGPYCIYATQPGDTLSRIASAMGLLGTRTVPPWQLLVESNRPELSSEDELLEVGLKLRIPLDDGLIHVVHRAETLSDIAVQFDVPLSDIATANGLSDVDALRIGQELLVPRPRQLTVLQPPSETPSLSAVAASEELRGPEVSPSGFSWPASGPISSYFGPAHPLGIDIDLYAAPGAANLAAAGGTVTFAGGNPCCSYGYYVIVDHGGGVQTLYAHFSSTAVSVGEEVYKGQPLGIAGSTGYSTGTHLHFEILVDGQPRDPLSYLP